MRNPLFSMSRGGRKGGGEDVNDVERDKIMGRRIERKGFEKRKTKRVHSGGVV